MSQLLNIAQYLNMATSFKLQAASLEPLFLDACSLKPAACSRLTKLARVDNWGD